jgi:hypothetical protein
VFADGFFMKGTVFAVTTFGCEFASEGTRGAVGTSGDAFEGQFSVVGAVEKEGGAVDGESVEGGATGDESVRWCLCNLLCDILEPFSISSRKESGVTLVGSDGKGPQIIIVVTIERECVPVASQEFGGQGTQMEGGGTDIVAVHHDKVFPGGVDGGSTDGVETLVACFGEVGGAYGAERVGVDEEMHTSRMGGLVPLEDGEGIILGSVVGDNDEVVGKETTDSLHVAEDTFEVGSTIFDGTADATTGTGHDEI